MRAPLQRPAFGAVVHPAHAGRQPGLGARVKPFQLARDLQRQFPRRGNRQRAAGLSTAIRLKQVAAEKGQEINVCVLEKGSEVGVSA